MEVLPLQHYLNTIQTLLIAIWLPQNEGRYEITMMTTNKIHTFLKFQS